MANIEATKQISQSKDKVSHIQSINTMENYQSQLGHSTLDVAKDEARRHSKGPTISICFGSIAFDTADVIINEVNDTFDISKGTIARSLQEGDILRMQEECSSNPILASPILRVTLGGCLQCHYVLHLITPQTKEEVTYYLKEAIKQAKILGATSFSLPTVGLGVEESSLTAADVSASMSKAFETLTCEDDHEVKKIKVFVNSHFNMNCFQKELVKDNEECIVYAKRALKHVEMNARTNSMNDNYSIIINSSDAVTLKQVEKEIRKHIGHNFISKVIQTELMSKLDEHDYIEIYQRAIKYKASVTFDTNRTLRIKDASLCLYLKWKLSRQIFIDQISWHHGVPLQSFQLKAVEPTNTRTSEITMKGFNENVFKLYDFIRGLLFELQESLTMLKLSAWKWTDSSFVFTAMPLRVGRELEREYEVWSGDKCFFTVYGRNLTVDFAAMSYEFNRSCGLISRIVTAIDLKMPSDWIDMKGNTWMKVPLDSNSQEYNKIFERFSDNGYFFSEILSIERIQHPSLYKQYLIKKNDVERGMVQGHPVEQELFHGTAKENVDHICAEGFDRNFAGKHGTRFGKGTYFATTAIHSTFYCKGIEDTKYMFLARVLTGDYCVGKESMVRPPEKVSPTGGAGLHDSVVDNVVRPKLYVVFKDASVYPYYLITYKSKDRSIEGLFAASRKRAALMKSTT